MTASIKILLVEDDDSIRESLCELFTCEGFTFLAANDGLEAIEILEKKSFQPDVIMLDLNMPRMSGKEFLRERGDRGLAPHARVLMLSATAEIQGVENVDAWIRKPVELDRLLDAIRKYGVQ
jgi:two-component system, OmpR family, response regulator